MRISDVEDAGRWCDLPPELLLVIVGGLQNPIDVIRFRSVCRSWRSSIPPSPNILFPVSPLEISSSWNGYREQISLIAVDVYLLCPRGDPSTSLMVSVEKSNDGKLLVRHPLTYESTSLDFLDLSEWSATQIARSYKLGSWKAVLASSDRSGNHHYDCGSGSFSRSRDSEAMAVYISDRRGMCAFRFSLIDGNSGSSQFIDGVGVGRELMEDCVSFNGCIYAVDKGGCVYRFDSKALQLLPIKCIYPTQYPRLLWCYCRKRFVVSDGDLHLVLNRPPLCYGHMKVVDQEIYLKLRLCQVLKLVMDMDGADCNVECADSLGGRVFFINQDCSFSVPAGDLPHPWIGDCVVFQGQAFGNLYGEPDIEVFGLGVEHPKTLCRLMPWLQGYSDLFAPPRQMSENKKKDREIESCPTDQGCLKMQISR